MRRVETHLTSPHPTDLIFDRVSLSFGDKQVLRELSFRVAAGGRLVLMGASGGGKTSVLRLAAGLLAPSGGRIEGGGRVSVQFQEPRLLPWLTAAENINVVLSDRKKTLPTANAWLERVDLVEAADLYPDELSGGMAQRVALCRALAAPADVLLLDEPFRGLDEGTKQRVMEMVADSLGGRTLLLTTHDSAEAAFFSGDILRIG